MKEKLGGKIMKAIVAQRPKMYNYDCHIDKKVKRTKTCVTK